MRQSKSAESVRGTSVTGLQAAGTPNPLPTLWVWLTPYQLTCVIIQVRTRMHASCAKMSCLLVVPPRCTPVTHVQNVSKQKCHLQHPITGMPARQGTSSAALYYFPVLRSHCVACTTEWYCFWHTREHHRLAPCYCSPLTGKTGPVLPVLHCRTRTSLPLSLRHRHGVVEGHPATININDLACDVG